jgi:hypothetical protein
VDADNLSGAGENFFLRCAAGKHVDRLLRARAKDLAQVLDHDLLGIHRTLSWLADVRPRSAYIVARKKCGLPTISDSHMRKYDTPIFFFCRGESRRLAGQGFASSIGSISTFFPVSRQSKWWAVFLSFSTARSVFQHPLNHIQKMGPVRPRRFLADLERRAPRPEPDANDHSHIKNDGAPPFTNPVHQSLTNE